MSRPATEPSHAECALPLNDLETRVQRIVRESRDKKLGEALRRFVSGRSSVAQLNTTLMDSFREHRNLEAYSLLYELNHREFLTVILKRLRFAHTQVDAYDVLQDVFISIFRYPHKFRDEKEFSFRNWSYSIIRNTVLKHLRGASGGTPVSADTLAESLEDEQQASPLAELVTDESRDECGHLWLIVLANYLSAFESRLNERERKALTLVEVEGVRYREASDRLGIKLENLKMVICRARKKIYRLISDLAGGDE